MASGLPPELMDAVLLRTAPREFLWVMPAVSRGWRRRVSLLRYRQPLTTPAEVRMAAIRAPHAESVALSEHSDKDAPMLLLANFKSLRRLHVNARMWLPESYLALRRVLIAYKQLEQLELSAARPMGLLALTATAHPAFESLRVLRVHVGAMHSSMAATQTALLALAAAAPNLREMLVRNVELPPGSLACLLTTCPKLASLHLLHPIADSDPECLAVLGRFGGALEDIIVTLRPWDDAEHAVGLFKHCRRLNALTLRNVSPAQEAAVVLSAWRNEAFELRLCTVHSFSGSGKQPCSVHLVHPGRHGMH